MKTLRRSLLAFASALAIVFAVGCASTSTREGTGEYIDDSVITAKVKTAILNESSLKVGEINVETYKGEVQLTGFVSSEADVEKAAEIAKGVPGVKSVSNGIQVK